MLIRVYVDIKVVFELTEEAFKLFDLLPVFQLLRHEILGKLLGLKYLCLFLDEGGVLVIELEVSLNKLHEEELVIADKLVDARLSILGGVFLVAFIGNLVA